MTQWFQKIPIAVFEVTAILTKVTDHKPDAFLLVLRLALASPRFRVRKFQASRSLAVRQPSKPQPPKTSPILGATSLACIVKPLDCRSVERHVKLSCRVRTSFRASPWKTLLAVIEKTRPPKLSRHELKTLGTPFGISVSIVAAPGSAQLESGPPLPAPASSQRFNALAKVMGAETFTRRRFACVLHPGLLTLALACCAASPDQGFDPSTRTYVSPQRVDHKAGGYRITCERETEQCIRRAEVICGGRYAIIGRPSRSPQVQALVAMKITAINSDNPSRILIACGGAVLPRKAPHQQ